MFKSFQIYWVFEARFKRVAVNACLSYVILAEEFQGVIVPETASFACWQTHAGSQQLHPKVCCEPNSAGSQCTGPKGQKENTPDEIFSNTIIFYFADFKVLAERSAAYLNVLSQWVEYLLGNRQSFGEVDSSSLVDDIFARVVPVEVADRFLKSRVTLVHYENSGASKHVWSFCCFIFVFYTPEDVADSPRCW